MAQFRDFYFTFMTDEEFNVIEGTIEDFLDWMLKTEDIHPPKTGISVHFSDFFHPNGDAKLLIFSDSGHF